VKRAVWERDGGRCTFTSDDGHRCEARVGLEFDHIVPVACGGESTVGNVRVRCRPHNQFAAEQAFGADFMAAKREAARLEREAAAVAACVLQASNVRGPGGAGCCRRGLTSANDRVGRRGVRRSRAC